MAIERGAVQHRLGPLTLAIVVGVFTSAGGASRSAFREDELQCEEAAAHISDCCGSVPAGLACTYQEDGCAGPAYPSLNVEQSRCVRALSCGEVRAQGLCDAGTWQDGALRCS